MKNKRIYICLWVLLICGTVIGIYHSLTRLTYLEKMMPVGEVSDTFEISDNNDSIEQEFVAPYEIVQGVSFLIGTHDRDNDSIWMVSIREKATGKLVIAEQFEAGLFINNGFNKIDFSKKVKVNKGEDYVLTLEPVYVDADTALAFYLTGQTDSEKYFKECSLGTDVVLDCAIYGCDKDVWWIGYCVVIALFLATILIRMYFVLKKNGNILEDKMLQMGMVVCISFILLKVFANVEGFTDEYDNICGGMMIARGKVLYRDYVTQHTPVPYYLCGLFALLGAKSVEQFRLCYYILEALVLGALYSRYSNILGKRKMFVLPIAEIVLLSLIIPNQSNQIIADNVQGLCILVLALEFLYYCKEQKFDWKRSIIVSCCLWGSIGSAFVSAYAVIWVVLAVSILEIISWKDHISNVKSFLTRYDKLFIACLIPLVIGSIYFGVNNALKIAFDQFYVFNTEVYSRYMEGWGTNFFEPFINAVQYTCSWPIDNCVSLVTGPFEMKSVLQLVVLLGAITIVVKLLIKKQYCDALVLFSLMCFSATRGYGFHAAAAWMVAVLLIVGYSGEWLWDLSMKKMYLVVAASVLLLGNFVVESGNHILKAQDAISDMESFVIAHTDSGDGIFIDAFAYNPVYFIYKDRVPVNRVFYLLPWYMDWYAMDTVYDLAYHEPKIAIYAQILRVNELGECNGKVLREILLNYNRVSEDQNSDWKYNVWIRNQ